MSSNNAARIAEHTAMDVIDRILSEGGDKLDRIVIVAVEEDGETCRLYSNARSEPEMHGLLWHGLNKQHSID